MQAPPQQLDVVSLVVAISAVFFGPELAAIVGPYAVIIIGSALGAGWSSSRIETRTRKAIVLHMVGMITLAILVTVPLALMVSQHLGYPVNWMFGPLAGGIGALGPDGLSWLGREGAGAVSGNLRLWLSRRLGGAPKDDPPNQPPEGPRP